MKVLHFGAGRIGLGLITPFFSGMSDLTVVDRKSSLISKLRADGYRVIESNDEAKTVRHIGGFDAVKYSELEAVDDVDVITTSVIEKNLPDIVPFISEVIRKSNNRIYIIPMENSFDSISIIRKSLEKGSVNLDNVYFLRSVIDRIVSGFTPSGDLMSEPHFSVMIENKFDISEIIPNNFLSYNIKYEYDKKFYIVNGLHACAAYLGYEKKFTYIHECVSCSEIEKKLVNIGACYSQYLCAVHGVSSEEINAYILLTLDRFKNSSICDEISRVGRNLMIKLSERGRIMKPLIYNRKKGLMYKPLLDVVRAANNFSIAEDYDGYLKVRIIFDDIS